jgi:SAM-dependent methyltransferase
VRLSDPSFVREEYADESRLAARKRAHERGDGPDAREIVFAAVRDAQPGRVLEVGCGEGELAERVLRELGADVVAIDQSARMVELTRRRGVDARLGDVQDLDVDDETFDCAVAAWMLFHAEDVARALAELARVLPPGGRLVAATNGPDHLCELYELLEADPLDLRFNSANGEAALWRHFSSVTKIDAHGWLVFADAAEAQAYVDSLLHLSGKVVPDVEGPIRARRTPSVFVCTK